MYYLKEYKAKYLQLIWMKKTDCKQIIIDWELLLKVIFVHESLTLETRKSIQPYATRIYLFIFW